MNVPLMLLTLCLIGSCGQGSKIFGQNPIPVSPSAVVPRSAQRPASLDQSPAGNELGTATASATVASVAAASGDYVLATSDTVEMSVFHQPDLNTRSPIAHDGTVQFPLIGEVRIAGLSLRNAREIIRKRYNSDYLVEPQVYLNVVAYAQRTFTILGQVAKPGTYDFPGGKSLSLLEGVGMAGGFTRLADRSSVLVKRSVDNSERTFKVKSGDRSKKFELQPNDVVTIGESWF